jgi:FixJ family two-component response regulator
MVFIVDDEESVRNGFSLLLRSAGLPYRAFSSAKQFLVEVDPQEEGCVLLDITMPQVTGLELQKELKRRKFHLRVIAISARDDADTAILARQLGAQFFFRKPVDDQALIDAIHWVMGSDGPTPTQSGPLPSTSFKPEPLQ